MGNKAAIDSETDKKRTRTHDSHVLTFQIAKNINTILMRIAKIKVKTSKDISLHLSLTLARQHDREDRSQSLLPSLLVLGKRRRTCGLSKRPGFE